MNIILTPEMMQLADLKTQEFFNVPSIVLMERAAIRAYEIICDENNEFDLARVLVIAGCGNNGGDALALARLFYENDRKCDVYICGDESKGTESFLHQKRSLKAYGCEIMKELPGEAEGYTTIVDGLFGISLNRDIKGSYLEAVNYINSVKQKGGCRVLALDMPSGIHAGSGHVMGAAVRADVTVTFGFKKVGQLLYPGCDYCGKIYAFPIGITKKSLVDDLEDMIYEYQPEDIVMPKRAAYSNKGTFGKVLLIAGSAKISGAAVLAGLSAMRAGAGMLKIITHEDNRAALMTLFPEAMYEFYDDKGLEESVFYAAVKWSDVIAVGPGIGTGDIARALTEMSLRQKEVPVVADADALNIISEGNVKISDAPIPVIVTPHLGEMSRLSGESIKELAADLIGKARAFAKDNNCICVLKDARTVIAAPSGKCVINTYGNSGMATAGSGDVLTGIIAAFTAAKLDIFEAAALGCAIHGRAGEEGVTALSEHELLARDIIKYIGKSERNE